MKSSVEQIRNRFDHDVERFSDVSAGQATAIDSAMCLDLIAEGSRRVCPDAKSLLDVGCGAGNWSIKLLGKLPGLDVTLMDLSQPMLDRATDRVRAAGASSVRTVQADVRAATFADGSFDLIVAGAVLHHLRSDDEWRAVFAAFHRWLRPGGSVWVYDLLSHESPGVESIMTDRYADHLKRTGDEAYVKKVFAYIAEEDSPVPITYQIDRLREAGFSKADVLHKNAAFGAYVGIR
jgi:tRNA (cmo5U34)-methyltransferase